jgi:hypothetical protein
MLSTLKGWQLVSTGEFQPMSQVEQQQTLDFFVKNQEKSASAITPDKGLVMVGENRPLFEAVVKTTPKAGKLPEKLQEEFQAREDAKPEKRKKQKSPKYARVAEAVYSQGAERSFFASEVVEFSAKKVDNVKVFTLLATFILFSLRSLKQSLEKGDDFSTRRIFPARVVDPEANALTVSHIEVANGIDFSRLPSFDQPQKYFVIKQLGYGSRGVCCLAITQKFAVACVIKFFHLKTGTIEEDHAAARKEADMWWTIYGTTYSFSAKSILFPTRAMLVMPYIQIPRNYEERQALVEGEKNSLLYLALVHFSNQGYAHADIYWHHVGTFTIADADNSQGKKFAALCDLGDLVDLHRSWSRKLGGREFFCVEKSNRRGQFLNNKVPASVHR